MVFCQDKSGTNIFPSFTPAYWADTGVLPYENPTTTTFIISRSLSDLGTKEDFKHSSPFEKGGKRLKSDRLLRLANPRKKIRSWRYIAIKKPEIHVWNSGFLKHFLPSAKNGGRYWTRTSDLLRVEQAL